MTMTVDQKKDILLKLSTGKISVEDATKLLAATGNGGSLGCKVSEKGGLSVYGLQRMPVTLYVEQWERLLAFTNEIKAFMKANDKSFSRKADKTAA